MDLVIDTAPLCYTPNESWNLEVAPGHTYERALAWTFEFLGAGQGRKLLVIGSPPAEAFAGRNRGWAVTYVDIRRVPPRHRVRLWQAGIKVKQENAMRLEEPDDSFDAVSSTCVLCHVGLGRYNDPVADDGDRRMLAELARVIKPGGRIGLMAGPLAEQAAIQPNAEHRITSWVRLVDILPPSLAWVATQVWAATDGWTYVWIGLYRWMDRESVHGR